MFFSLQSTPEEGIMVEFKHIKIGRAKIFNPYGKGLNET
jgi:hypothetical protein